MLADILVTAWIVLAVASTIALRIALPLFDHRGRPQGRRRVLVIVSVEGMAASLEAFVERLARQDHPDFRVVLAIAGKNDAAWPYVDHVHRSSRFRTDIAIAGDASGATQEAWNLTAALQHIEPSDDVIVFARPDILPQRDWLSVLDWAVVDQKQPFVSGHQLIVPADTSFPARALASLNLSFAGAIKPAMQTMVWGGTAAITPAFLRKLDPAACWAGAMDPIAALGIEAASRGVPAAVQRCALVPTPWSGGLADALARARRDMMPLFRHRTQVFWVWLACAILPIAGCAVAVARLAGGDVLALLPIGIVAALAWMRSGMRRAIVQRVANEGDMAAMADWLTFDRLMRPAWWPLLAPAMLLAMGRKVSLGGKAYLWTADKGARLATPPRNEAA